MYTCFFFFTESVSAMEGPSLRNFDRCRWKIIARVARLWEHWSVDRAEFYGMILVDRKVNVSLFVHLTNFLEKNCLLLFFLDFAEQYS